MFKKFLDNFWQNIVSCFSGYNILWHVLAIGLTYIIVTSGFDWFYFTSTRKILLENIALVPAIIGFFMPIIIPIIIFLKGTRGSEDRNTIVAIAVAQAELIGFLISIFYKAFTGRVGPVLFAHGPLVDISQEFHFGFLRGGVFWGWPSSHTTVAFAMSAALIALYPKNKKIIFFALFYAFFIGLGVSVSIHWFSDFVAGAILGSVAGIVVGKSFYNKIQMWSAA